MKQLASVVGISLFSALANPAYAEINQVDIHVDGLACPFCAYGLEKKLLGLDGTREIKIYMDKGIVTAAFNDSSSVTVKSIEQAVKDAGFTPNKYNIKATGRFFRKQKPSVQDYFEVSVTRETYKVQPNPTLNSYDLLQQYEIIGNVKKRNSQYIIIPKKIKPIKTKEK